MDDKLVAQSSEVSVAKVESELKETTSEERMDGLDTEHALEKDEDQSLTSGSIDGAAFYPNSESSTSECSSAPLSSLSCATSSTDNKCDKVKQKARERHKNLDKSNLICGVCGDKSTGFHFGAITCESCKAFFRRRALKDAEPCVSQSTCKMDPVNRKFCVDCRMRKCLEIGMRKDWILDEEARAKRKKPIRRSSLGKGDGASNNRRSLSGDRKGQVSCQPSAPPQPLTLEQQEEINMILRQHSLIDAPNHDQNGDPSVTASSKLFSTDTTEFDQLTDQPQHVTQVMNMIGGFITRFIPFIKSLHGYSLLNLQDRIAVLKNCMMETMAIRSAIQYDPNIGGFSVEDFNSGARKNLQLEFIRAVFGEELYNEHMNFITSFNSAAQWDRPTMILAMLINLFASDQLDVENKSVLEEAQMHYSELLQAYLRSRYRSTEAKAIYPRLMMKLADVREYGENSRKAIEKQNVASSPGMEPLLKEIFSESA